MLSILNLSCVFLSNDFNGCSLMDDFNELNRLRKEINRLLSEGMSNIYLKVTMEKNGHSQNFDSLVKKFVTRSVFG